MWHLKKIKTGALHTVQSPKIMAAWPNLSNGSPQLYLLHYSCSLRYIDGQSRTITVALDPLCNPDLKTIVECSDCLGVKNLK